MKSFAIEEPGSPVPALYATLAEGVSYSQSSLGLHLLLTGICLLNHITLSLQETQADIRKEISRVIPFLRQKLNYN